MGTDNIYIYICVCVLIFNEYVRSHKFWIINRIHTYKITMNIHTHISIYSFGDIYTFIRSNIPSFMYIYTERERDSM